jgi:SAM-dependent methyltransferase
MIGVMDRHQWDERYATDELIWRGEPNRFLVEEVAAMEPGRALDLACGEGRNAIWLAERGWTVTGVDFSPVGLAKASRLAAERGVRVSWIEKDVVAWSPPDESFDLVIVLYLQLPSEARHRALSGAAGAVAPGGTILVVGHDSTNLTEGHGGPQDPAVLYGTDDLVGDLGGLEVIRAQRVRRTVDTDGGEAEAIDALVRARKPLRPAS